MNLHQYPLLACPECFHQLPISRALLGTRTMTSERDIAGMRRPYHDESLLFKETDLVSKEPYANFRHWFDLACDNKSLVEPNAMSLSTCSTDGQPSSRMLLLKGFDETGFKFFTNYNSRKSKDLDDNPRAAMLFYWDALMKVVRIEGSVEKLSTEEATTYFHSRPRCSQISANVSLQSTPIANREALSAEYEAALKNYADESITVPKPESWGGYVLKPTRVEFWQGQTTRLHDRIVFRKPAPGETVDPAITQEGDDGWFYERLAP